MSLRDEVTKLAHEQPLLRADLVPILRRTASWNLRVALSRNEFLRLMDIGGNFGILSAYQSGPKHENQTRHGELVGDLQRLGYRQFSTLRGAWGGKAEKSIIVPGIQPSDLFMLGAKYGQDSVIYKSKEGVVGMYYIRDHKAEIAVDPKAGGPAVEVALNDEEFSKERNWSFSLGFLWGQEIPWDGRKVFSLRDIEFLITR